MTSSLPTTGALAGIRVLDISRILGGPYCGQILGDHGVDVLIENFKTGTMERWGIGPEVLMARFPRLVWCRVSGFGSDGPLGGLPGYDAAVQAMTGIMSVNGEADVGPLRVGLPVVDMVRHRRTAGLAGATAQRERERAFVEAVLYDGGLSLLHPHGANWFVDGKAPRRTGNAHPNILEMPDGYRGIASPIKRVPRRRATGMRL